MSLRRCRCCRRVFQPAPYHPQQQVSSPPVSVNDSGIITGEKFVPIPSTPRSFAKAARSGETSIPVTSKCYRQTHPGAVERNRQRQHFRDQGRRLQKLVKNNLAASQLLILQPVEPFPSVGHVSCKEHASGLAGGCGL